MRTRTGLLLATFALAACGGGDTGGDSNATPAPPATPPASTASSADTTITPAMLAFGDSIFTGKAAGGICYTCHGPDAKGTPLAPDLTDNTWINGDGSLSFIMSTVSTGVPQPKEHAAPMPPFVTFTPQQLRAVASYVYSLSHPMAP